MLSLASAPLGFSAPSLAPVVQPARADVRMETIADLESLAKKLNPVDCRWTQHRPVWQHGPLR